MKQDFLPISKSDMEKRGWDECDIILITGDPYIDHHSCGIAVMGRILEKSGYKVGIIAQPDWNNTDDFKKLGKPKLFFGITSGNIDSMMANYTSNKRPRRQDKLSSSKPRPDRALIVYSNRIKECFKGIPIVIGGLEASMRRLAHYDYWSDKVRRSILLDTRGDILVYGMGERQIIEIADRFKNDKDISGINGTVIIRNDYSFIRDFVKIPSFEEVSTEKYKFNQAYKLFYKELSPKESKTIIQKHGNRFIIQFPPSKPLTQPELDAVYGLPYMREPHPEHNTEVKNFEMIQNSITALRGCPGECNFCGIGLHQGRIVQSRSEKSIIKEAVKISQKNYFHGTISDIGGPTANLYKSSCSLWEKGIVCKDKNCLTPKKCKNLKLNYNECISLYKKVNLIDKIKHVFINSGLRYDLLVDDYANKYLEILCKNHISGRMKVAPEHVSEKVLKAMNKPEFSVYENFVKKFEETKNKLKKNIFLVNYFISSHPGSGLKDAYKLSNYCKKSKIYPEQIQDFTPLPMTVASCMYYTEKDPFTNKDLYIPRTEKERTMQRALVQHRNPKYKKIITAALNILKK